MSSETHCFDPLCELFEQQLVDLQSLRTAHDETVSATGKLQSQLAQTIEEGQQYAELKESQILVLSAQIKNATGQNKELLIQKDQVIANLRAKMRRQQKTFASKRKKQCTREKKLNDKIQASSKALTRANQALEEQRVLCGQLAQRAEEGQQLPRSTPRSTFAARVVQPFVMVLIDGDAYKVLHPLPHRSAGVYSAVH
jgi:neutral trehalase